MTIPRSRFQVSMYNDKSTKTISMHDMAKTVNINIIIHIQLYIHTLVLYTKIINKIDTRQNQSIEVKTYSLTVCS